MRSLPLVHSFLLSFSPLSVLALSIPFSVRTPDTTHHHLPRQSSTSSVVPVGNTQNAFYYSNITLGGRQISVMLDTGSSDLWVTGSVPGAHDTGNSLTLSYSVGNAAGDVYTAPFQFDGYTVQDQAFLLVNDTSTFSTDIHAEGYDGLIGLGPNSGSSIYKKLSGDSGNSALNRIFVQNSSSDNYLTLMLSRNGDPGSQIAGQFTISSVVPGFENITNQPKLPVEKVYKLTNKDQHWQILTDKGVGIIGPDGQPINYDSIVPKAPSGQIVAVLDSGFTLPQVPRSVSDAIYGRVQGAEWSTSNQAWLVPCGQLINVTFNFGGISYPVHPLDVSSSDFGVTFSNGNSACLGTFQPISSAFSLLGEYDMILGMAFLRNIYTLIDFGNLVKGGSSSNNPYIQLLSLTNETAAVNDFISVRLNGQNLINSPQYALLPASQQQYSPETAAQKKAQYEEKVLSHWPYILSGCLVVVLLLVAYCVWRCCCRRKRLAKKKAANQQAGPTPGGSANSSYAKLPDSGSTASLAMKPMRGSTLDFNEECRGDAFARR
ncbi:aspartic peptidase domain-containing protein [Boletus edulis BED1]|uniref:Aspartic peptidase domain-containing protein n=1 Tax=Boletus edulis BED1 TaxID=1328754 RepID=A0AAD4BYA2_BOLED|nr:aspartic peptidase domain-containing protein [Boletus edulis BED1]